MGKLVEGDDSLPAEDVGRWAKEKHDYLRRYIDISRATRAKFLGPGKAGAGYIDLFCGPGRARIRDTGEWVDGGVVAAWKQSVEGGAPFSQVIIADADPERRQVAGERLRRLGAPVTQIEGTAAEAARGLGAELTPYGLHFAFLDPFDLAALDFEMIERLSKFKRIDMLVHVSQMDLQRNAVSYATAEDSAFDTFAPGWRDQVNIAQPQQALRQDVFRYWREKVAALGVWTSTEMKLLKGDRKQPLYWLLLASRHKLAHSFWTTASNSDGQANFGF